MLFLQLENEDINASQLTLSVNFDKIEDCKCDDLVFKIPNVFNNNNNATKIFELYQDLLNKIGNSLKNNKWFELYDLISSNKKIISKLEHFIQIFNKNMNNYYFHVKV